MENWPKHDDFLRSFDDHETKMTNPYSPTLDMPMSYNPSYDMDIGTPVGYINHVRHQEDLSKQLLEQVPQQHLTFGRFFSAIGLTIAVGVVGAIILSWIF